MIIKYEIVLIDYNPETQSQQHFPTGRHVSLASSDSLSDRLLNRAVGRQGLTWKSDLHGFTGHYKHNGLPCVELIHKGEVK